MKLADAAESLADDAQIKTKSIDAAEIIANVPDFDKEFKVGYDLTHKIDRWGHVKTEFIRMDKARKCSYNSNTGEKLLGEPVSNRASTAAVENRGITLRQLRAIRANINRRCISERWRSSYTDELLTPSTVTLYDVEKYIILPLTVKAHVNKSPSSFVQCLPSTAGEQRPRFFISHWWGEPVVKFIACIEQLVEDFSSNNCEDHESRGGGMTDDTPIWVCAYANDQWDLSDITENPAESGFKLAMDIAEGRTVTILDNQATVFKRIWCIYELHLTLNLKPIAGIDGSKDRLWAVYTAHKHKYDTDSFDEHHREAVGIVSGGATSDCGNDVTNREKHFPPHLITAALKIKVEEADATVGSDKIHILNAIIGTNPENINDKPPETHVKYNELNIELKANFASSYPSLKAAWDIGEETWKAMLEAMSKGKMKNGMELDFKSESAWGKLKLKDKIALISNLPLTIQSLKIAHGPDDRNFINAVQEFKNKCEKKEKRKIKYKEIPSKKS